MNSYTLGLNSAWWVAILVAIVCLGAAIWYYQRSHPPLRPSLRLSLTFLRALALTLLAFVLLEPVLSLVRSETQQAQVAILLDNSASMKTSDAGGARLDTYRSAFQSAKIESLSEKTGALLFDESVKTIASARFDSLSFSGQRSDIERALRFVTDNAEQANTQAVLLVSDGAFNAGANPLYQAEQLAKPIYVIGIGDTNEARDVSVQSLLTNELSYVGSTLAVNARIKAVGFGDRSVRVQLSDNGTKIAEQELQLRENQQNYSLSFEYKATTEGMHKLSISCAALDGELTLKNNSLSEFVRVLSTKRKIVLFAGAPSPDVSFLKTALEADKSVQLRSYIQKTGSEFYDEAPNSAALREAEQIIFVGFPISSTSQSVIQLVLSELQRGKPLLFITSQNLDYTKLRLLDEFMPFTVQSSRANEFSVMADVRPSAASNPLLRIDGSAQDIDQWNTLPPLFRTETFVRVKPEAEVVATMKVNNVPLSDPLIVSRRFQKSKCVAVLGYGLYRWKLLGTGEDQAHGKGQSVDVLAHFMQNSMKWLQANDEEKTVRIRSSRKQYASSERIEFVAQVYDAAMTPLENASVTVKVSGGKEPRDIVLASQGAGRYSASMDALSEGDYSYTGTVVVNNKAYGSDGGRFSVGDVALEYQNLRMNVELLRSIAERSGGKFYYPKDAGSFADDLKQNKRFSDRVVSHNSEYSLWNLAWLLAAALLCFSLEWLIRKRAGMI